MESLGKDFAESMNGAQMRMEVIAVSHSLPQWLDVGPRKVHTSIIHTPLTNRDQSIELHPSKGIINNGTAAHNGEVYAFFDHQYDYWSKKLGVPRDSWDWCHWGENITFKCDPCILESNFHLGDIWKIGKSVFLQVCGGRVPCFKLAWRCGQKDSWLQELASTGRCGIYLKVIEGGSIFPGDAAHLVRKRSHGPLLDCATITRVAFMDALSTRSTMDLLVDDPDLLDMNKLLFRRKISMMYDQQLSGKNTWKDWRSVCVNRIVDESPGIKSFYMVSQKDPITGLMPLSTFLPGQFLTVRLPNGLIRSWSLSTYPDHESRELPQFYRISIKLDGVGSTWMHENCKPGTVLEIRAPSGKFCLDWSPQFPGRQVYFSAGIGITPVLSMLHAHMQHPAMQRAPAVWVHVSRTMEVMPFFQELRDLKRRAIDLELSFEVMLFITSKSQSNSEKIESHSDGESDWFTTYSGRPAVETLRATFENQYMMDPLKITPIPIPGNFSTVYMCGTKAFEESMRDILSTVKVPEAMILSESFSGEEVEAPTLESATVCFSQSDKIVEWRRQTPKKTIKAKDEEFENSETNRLDIEDLGPTLLELAEETGLKPDYGCRTGVCGACEVSLKCGKVAGGMQPGGLVRICIARPGSEDVAIEI